MWMWMMVACSSGDPDVAALEAEVAELRARVEALEARPALEAEALQQAARQLLGEHQHATKRLRDHADAAQPSGGGAFPAVVLDDLEAASRLGRFLPHRGRDGEFDGFRVSAVRRGSALDRVGIRNADVIHSVNGQSLAGLEGAMQAHVAILAARPAAVQLQITRRGARLTLEVPLDWSADGEASLHEAPPSVDANDAAPDEPSDDLTPEEIEREERRGALQERLRQRREQRATALSEGGE